VKRRVAVTGIGVVAPNGIGRKVFGEALFSGKSGIRLIDSYDTSKSNFKIAGEIQGFDAADYLPIHVVRKTDRFVHLGLTAAKEAIEDAGINLDADRLQKACVIIGSGQGGLIFHEQMILKYVENQGRGKLAASAVPRITSNAISAYIALHYGIKGTNQVIATACSSGAQAIGEAFRKIQLGQYDVAVTGGVEAPISPVMLEMYGAMMVLAEARDGDPAKASCPFDMTRNGFVISEGAGMLILENLEAAQERGAKIYGEICGFGSNCGAYHMVTPNPSGEDAANAMAEALNDAGMQPSEIQYINAHGTSTKWNDLAETKAVKILFKDLAPKIPISSIKSMIGHTIGAAGAIEAVACCVSLKEGMIPPTINLNAPDPECDLDYVPNRARKAELHGVMSNSFGFGSNNAVLIFRRG
jgi:3-oxoacyl-[acyl-carrier-protein] synthase II